MQSSTPNRRHLRKGDSEVTLTLFIAGLLVSAMLLGYVAAAPLASYNDHESVHTAVYIIMMLSI